MAFRKYLTRSVWWLAAAGKTIQTPALPNLRQLDVVTVKGQIVAGEHGNLSLRAGGVFKVERPQLPAGLTWPQ